MKVKKIGGLVGALIVLMVACVTNVLAQELLPLNVRIPNQRHNVVSADIEALHQTVSFTYTNNPWRYIFTSIRVGAILSAKGGNLELGGDLIYTFTPRFEGTYLTLSVTEWRLRVGPGIGYIYSLGDGFLVNGQVVYSLYNGGTDIDNGSPLLVRVSLGYNF